MVLRSCLCYRNCLLQKRTLLLYIKRQQHSAFYSQKYPGFILPQRTFTTATVSSLNKQLEKIDITTPSLSPLDQHGHDLDQLLDNKLSLKQTKSIYRQLAKLKPTDLDQLLSSRLISRDYSQSRKALLAAAAYWSIETICQLVHACHGKHTPWRLDLLDLVLAGYVVNKDLGPLLSILNDTTSVNYKENIPFYNAVLNKCLKQKQLDHVRQIVDLMKKNGVAPDIATFNILIRMKLTSHGKTLVDPKETFAIFTDMATRDLQPNQATFNTFIKHTCKHGLWDSLNTWLDMMEVHSIEPTPITSRIIFQSYVKHPSISALREAFDRVSDAVPTSEKEKLMNAGASALLNGREMKAAIDLLDKTMTSNKEGSSIYSYNLLMRALCMDGKLEKAQTILKSMISQEKDNIPKPDIISFTTIIHGLVRNEAELDQLNILYKQLMDQGLRTNNTLETVLLYGVVRANNMSKAHTLFGSILDNKDLIHLPRQHGDTALDEMIVYNIMIDFYFLYYHKSKSLQQQIPQEPFKLLHDAVENRRLKPTIATLNIMVKGLAILNKDLVGAEKMVHLLKSKGVDMDEKTVWYLTKSAYKQGQLTKARDYVAQYEAENKSIQGSGLLYLKSILNPMDQEIKKEQP